MKNIKNYIFKLFILICVIILSSISLVYNSYSKNKLSFGYDALSHIKILSKTPRISGTKSIISSQKYIKNEFQKYGYEVTEQNFKWPIKGKNITSKNIIAVKKGLNESQIIIGAHYDSYGSNGADDNASGVSSLLELSEKLSKLPLPYTIKFIAFDSEEAGLLGSRYFVNHMSKKEIDNTILYINIDSILTGDDLYIYGDYGPRGWFRDELLNISNNEKLNIKTSTEIIGQNKKEVTILKGECFDYSDHVYFRYSGIPFSHIESTNFDSTNKKTGYPNYRNKQFGMIIHSQDDNIDFIMKNMKNSAKYNLSRCISSIYKSLAGEPRIVITSNINDIKNIKYELYHNGSYVNTFYHLNSNKIIIDNLKKGTYKIKLINNTDLNIKCNLDNIPFKINGIGTFYMLYEDSNIKHQSKDYDGILIKMYGDLFDDKETSNDNIYKEFLKITNLDPKVIYNKDFSIDEMKKIIDENINGEETIPTFLNIQNNQKSSILKSSSYYKILSIICIYIIFMNIKKKQVTKV